MVSLLFLTAIVTRQPWLSDTTLGPMFFAVIGCVIFAVSVRTTKSNGEVRVTDKGLTVIQEGKERFFPKQDITAVSIQKLYRGRDGLHVREGGKTFWSKHTHCQILPFHLPLMPVEVTGVLFHTVAEDAERKFYQFRPLPFFIPTKSPEQLLAALNKMKA